MPEPRPSRTELPAWSRRVIADQGLALDAIEDEVAAIRALADQRGWGHATEYRADTHVDRRWRATVYRQHVPNARPWVARGMTGMGRTEGEALAIALARMLTRAERPGAAS